MNDHGSPGQLYISNHFPILLQDLGTQISREKKKLHILHSLKRLYRNKQNKPG